MEYVPGRDFSKMHTEAGYKNGIEYFEKAIEEDKKILELYETNSIDAMAVVTIYSALS